MTAKAIGDNAWAIPNVDGYKSAFFLTPHNLSGEIEGNKELFHAINRHLFGNFGRDSLMIWSWSNECSSYFEPGLEWWGAFLWTISHGDSQNITLIGASTTD